MITLTKEEAQQVLDALVFATPSGYGPTEVYKDSIVLLQNLLAHETPYEVGQRLHRQGRGISDIPTAVYSDGAIAEAYRGFEDARLAQPEPEPVADKYLMEVECTKCGAKQDGILTVNAPPQREWQGLTDEEMFDCLAQTDGEAKRLPLGFKWFAEAIEAKLKEKNSAT